MPRTSKRKAAPPSSASVKSSDSLSVRPGTESQPPQNFSLCLFPEKKKKNAGKENHIKISALTNLLIIKKKKKKLNSRWFL